MRVGSMLNVYVICNNALVHKQYVIANSTERVQWFLLTTGLKYNTKNNNNSCIPKNQPVCMCHNIIQLSGIPC
ncbi:hypothetical protein DYD63_20240 [Salmonella enterica]|uniref:Uncharacterized protein n=1 Tax=Salmonella enterica TaxID=28901 RepID=A0A5T5W757_SALER|nr:hypothetical protein [Salmonella enterica]